MLHFMSFHVAFHVALHTFHTHRAFHALHHIARHFMYHFMSFYHENLLHTHTWHLGLKREEIGSKCQALQ